MKYAGIVLCGGQSRRMGRAKAMLPFGPETMLARVVRLLGEVVQPIAVVGAAGQEVPELPPSVILACDRRPNRGPLEGLAAGLNALGDGPQAAFVTACDVPLLMPEFVRRMIELSAGYEIAVPRVDGLDQTLSAVYSTGILPLIESLLTAERSRPRLLFELVRTRRITADELTGVDPRLQSLANVNSPEDYTAALKSAGFDP